MSTKELTTAELAELKANFDGYRSVHAEACARGEHAFATNRWGYGTASTACKAETERIRSGKTWGQ
jgi:hypothetical protein